MLRSHSGIPQQPCQIPCWRLLDRYSDVQRESRIAKDSVRNADRERQLVCAGCGSPVTSYRHIIEEMGAHRHQCCNPHGIWFLLGCFAVAQVQVLGERSLEFTWFPGCTWQIANCPSCQVHLGWCFQRMDQSRFYGVILDHVRED